MALTFHREPKNRVAYADKAAVWISSTDPPTTATWTLLDDTVDLTINVETTEHKPISNRGLVAGFDDKISSVTITGKFLSSDEKIRQIWTDNSYQNIRAAYQYFWVQGAQMDDGSGTTKCEYWALYKAKVSSATTAVIGGEDRGYTFTAHVIANQTCADVAVAPPTGDACYVTAGVTTATIADGQYYTTADGALT